MTEKLFRKYQDNLINALNSSEAPDTQHEHIHNKPAVKVTYYNFSKILEILKIHDEKKGKLKSALFLSLEMSLIWTINLAARLTDPYATRLIFLCLGLIALITGLIIDIYLERLDLKLTKQLQKIDPNELRAFIAHELGMSIAYQQSQLEEIRSSTPKATENAELSANSLDDNFARLSEKDFL